MNFSVPATRHLERYLLQYLSIFLLTIPACRHLVDPKFSRRFTFSILIIE